MDLIANNLPGTIRAARDGGAPCERLYGTGIKHH